MDIGENYLNVLPFEFLGDAKLWANVGDDQIIHTYQDLMDEVTQLVDFQVVDLSKYDYEIYLYEKPFFNTPYLFIAIVLEHKDKKVFEYIRKDGAYWEGLKKHYKGGNVSLLNDEIVFSPNLSVIVDGKVVEKTVHPIPLYGHHHPNRTSFKMTGGACPSKGGDWAHYPWGDGGGGWPINYQEITPLCDGLSIDMKMFVNLFQETWDDPTFGSGNAGYHGATVIDYRVDANVYGEYTDPYLVKHKKENLHKINLTPDGKIVQNESEKHKEVIIPIEYPTKSVWNNFYAAPQVGLTKSTSLRDYCPKKCPNEPEPETCSKPVEEVTISHCPTPKPVNPDPTPTPVNPGGGGGGSTEVDPKPNPQGNQNAENALKMTYDIAKKVIGLALVLV